MTTPYGQDPHRGGDNPDPGSGGIPTWGPGTGGQPIQPQPTPQQSGPQQSGPQQPGPQQPTPQQPMTGAQPALNLPPLPPAKRGGGPLIGLAVLAVLALAAAGVFVFLWLGASGDRDDLDARYQQQTSALTSAQDGRKKAEAELASAKEEAETARTAQREAETDATSAGKCRTAARAFITAAQGTDQAKINATADALVAAC